MNYQIQRLRKMQIHHTTSKQNYIRGYNLPYINKVLSKVKYMRTSFAKNALKIKLVKTK